LLGGVRGRILWLHGYLCFAISLRNIILYLFFSSFRCGFISFSMFLNIGVAFSCLAAASRYASDSAILYFLFISLALRVIILFSTIFMFLWEYSRLKSFSAFVTAVFSFNPDCL